MSTTTTQVTLSPTASPDSFISNLQKYWPWIFGFGGALLILVLAMVVYCCLKRRKRTPDDDNDIAMTTVDGMGVGAGAFAGIASLPRSGTEKSSGKGHNKRSKKQERVGVIGPDALNAVFNTQNSKDSHINSTSIQSNVSSSHISASSTARLNSGTYSGMATSSDPVSRRNSLTQKSNQTNSMTPQLRHQKSNFESFVQEASILNIDHSLDYRSPQYYQQSLSELSNTPIILKSQMPSQFSSPPNSQYSFQTTSQVSSKLSQFHLQAPFQYSAQTPSHYSSQTHSQLSSQTAPTQFSSLTTSQLSSQNSSQFSTQTPSQFNSQSSFTQRDQLKKQQSNVEFSQQSQPYSLMHSQLGNEDARYQLGNEDARYQLGNEDARYQFLETEMSAFESRGSEILGSPISLLNSSLKPSSPPRQNGLQTSESITLKSKSSLISSKDSLMSLPTSSSQKSLQRQHSNMPVFVTPPPRTMTRRSQTELTESTPAQIKRNSQNLYLHPTTLMSMLTSETVNIDEKYIDRSSHRLSNLTDEHSKRLFEANSMNRTRRSRISTNTTATDDDLLSSYYTKQPNENENSFDVEKDRKRRSLPGGFRESGIDWQSQSNRSRKNSTNSNRILHTTNIENTGSLSLRDSIFGNLETDSDLDVVVTSLPQNGSLQNQLDPTKRDSTVGKFINKPERPLSIGSNGTVRLGDFSSSSNNHFTDNEEFFNDSEFSSRDLQFGSVAAGLGLVTKSNLNILIGSDRPESVMTLDSINTEVSIFRMRSSDEDAESEEFDADFEESDGNGGFQSSTEGLYSLGKNSSSYGLNSSKGVKIPQQSQQSSQSQYRPMPKQRK
ncbi:hypothetical protein HK096_009134 [Nowakowskiella sp. JEL0078]|nr:hypothetical protein HK096_009134 [Nowakowskiella sp. JEL0078]